MTQNPKNKSGFFTRLTNLLGGGALRAEKAQWEAFANAFPGEYCGFTKDNNLVISSGICALLNIDTIHSIQDIQSALSPASAAILENAFISLQNKGASFSITATSANSKKTFKLCGTSGKDSKGNTSINLIWIEDITAQQKVQQETENKNKNTRIEQERLQNILDTAPIPLWIRNESLEIVWCNRAYAQALETSPANIMAEHKEWPFKSEKKGKTRSPGKTLAQKALDSQHPSHAPLHVILSGKRRLMDIIETPLPPQKTTTLGAARDTTREEELEKEHLRDTAANKELLEQLGTAIGIYNSDQQLEFYNSAFSHLWSMEDSYLNTRPRLGDLMEKLRENRRLPEQADFRAFKQEWLDMFTRLIDPYDDMLYLPDGTALRILVIPHPMGGLMMTFEDVTSNLELESSYNILIAVQRETLDNLAEGVSVYGGDGRLKLCNPSFARLWHLHPEDLEGEPHVTRLVEKMKSNITADDWEKTRDSLLKQALDRKSREGHLVCKKNRLIEFATVPLPDGGMLVTHIDVTDTVRVEKALREKNAALEAAEQLKTDFLANVSYQLRTPLSTIMGFTEILDNEYFGPLNEKQKEYTAGMQQAGNQLLNLINDILDLSTIEAGYMTLEPEEISVHELLHSLYDLMLDWARTEKIEIKLSCAKNIGKASLDPRRVKQVLLNLIRNAIAFTPSGGTITISAKKDKENNKLILSVSDTGEGIAKEDQDRIFKPFERVQKTSQADSVQPPSGAGLGLTLVKNIVELHGGTIKMTSRETQGTTVTMNFPLESLKTNKANAV